MKPEDIDYPMHPSQYPRPARRRKRDANPAHAHRATRLDECDPPANAEQMRPYIYGQRPRV